MHIRPVQPPDRAEWLRMRLQLWGGAAAEHTHEMHAYFASPQAGVTFVVERPAGGLGGFIEVSLRNYAEGCPTSPVAYIEGWYVDSDLRRRTVGSQLIHAAEAWARRRGPVACRLPTGLASHWQAAGPAGRRLVASAAQGVHSQRDCDKIAFEIPILRQYDVR